MVVAAAACQSKYSFSAVYSQQQCQAAVLAFIIAAFAVAASAAVVAASAGISTVAAALLGVEVRMVLVNAGRVAG